MALSGAVIMAAYTMGYVRTEGAAQRAMARLTVAEQAAVAGQAQGARSSAAPVGPSASAAAGGTSATAPAASAGPASGTAASAATATAASAAPPAPSSASAASAAPPAPSSASAASAAAPPPSSASAASATAAPGYANGTFTGQGWGPHGPITAAVVIRRGQIVSANITQCGTTYPCYYITPLLGEVVARQSAQTDYVSGATASSIAYQQAVAAALAQA